MIDKILIAVEDLYFIDAIESFVSQLQENGRQPALKVLHVIDPKEAVYAWPGTEYRPEYREESEAVLVSATERLSKTFANLHVEGLLREGDVKEEIVKEAELWSADLILMGPHGKKGIQKFILGSVAKDLIPLAPCSVVLLRGPKNKAATKAGMSPETETAPRH